MRSDRVGYRCDRLRTRAQRVEADKKEPRIMGSKSVLQRALVAAEGTKTGGPDVPVLHAEWRPAADENRYYCFAMAL
jgi:hypothetical protein